MEFNSVFTKEAPAAIASYSQAIIAGELVFVSGQIGLIPETGKLVEGGIEEETKQTLRNLQAILVAAGSGLDKVVKCTVLLSSMDDYNAVNAIYAAHFHSPLPSRAAFATSGLPRGAKVEIDAIATL
ncbi:MAG: Rid family detoxifying hydrolase [Myxococcota bacterium]|jgi:2-iminobutanoate/2-iminopropanoate deaminase|nr:Rid family detoxifying hydrolase [Myxococcota bacterium]